MCIERLKEDVRNIEYDLEYGEEQNQGRIAVSVNCLRSVIDFTNEAIAQQAVKSEEVAISKTEIADCKWCNDADRMVVSVKTISDSGEWVGIKRFLTNKSHFCPNCGRRLDKQ